MLQRAVATFLLVILFCPIVRVHGADGKPAFRAGAAVVDIVPREFPISMLGSFSDRPATSAHDPLQVRALVFDDGRIRIAIAVCDNCKPRNRWVLESSQLPNQEYLGVW